MSEASATRPRRADGIATSVLLILGALVQLLSKIADDNMKSFGAAYGHISTFDVRMLTALDWGGWLLLVAAGSVIAALRRYGRLGWPWALLLLAALIAISCWSTAFAGS